MSSAASTIGESVYVAPELLRRAAHFCGPPAVTLGTITLAAGDLDAWDFAIGKATPGERATLLLRLHDELLAVSEAGRERLWVRPDPYAEVDAEPFVLGDAAILPIVKAALALAPDVVRWAVQRSTAFLAVSAKGGFTSSANFIDAFDNSKTRIVCLGTGCSVFTALHEIAHVWCLHQTVAVTVQGEAGITEVMERDVNAGAKRMRKHHRFHETLADALATCWLLRSVNAERPS